MGDDLAIAIGKYLAVSRPNPDEHPVVRMDFMGLL
jgi:hypothetical protein